MNIREFEMSDKLGITTVFSESNVYHTALQPSVFNVLPLDSLITDDWLQEIKDSKRKNIYLCESEDEIAGVILFTKYETDDDLEKIKKFVFVNELAVLKKFRGLGIGKKLMDAVEDFAKDFGAQNVQLEVWENNSNAINFYERNGFKLKKLKYWKDI